MKKTRFLIGMISLLAVVSVDADVSLPAIINSHMVVQRGVQAPIWGWADPGEKVSVSFAGQVQKTVANAAGKWMVKLDPLAASAESRPMVVQGKNAITLDDVLVGEVWIASGQSNMEFSIGAMDQEEQDIAAAQINNKQLRMFCVAPKIKSSLPLSDTAGYWSGCSYFIRQMQAGKIKIWDSHSAVGFFFGLKLQQELNVPVAVIDTSWGGTAVEPWIADEGYAMEGIAYRKVPPNQEAAAIAVRDQLMQDIARWRESAKTAVEHGQMVSANMKVPKTSVDNAVYNGMVAPLVPYAVKGTVWYQGEGNRGSTDYFEKLKALTGGWAKVFDVPNIPFYLVQVAPYNYAHAKAPEMTPQSIYDSVVCDQYKAAKEIAGCEVINIPDTVFGNVKNVHPTHKKTAGDRLAALALHNDYGKDVIWTGPRFQKAILEGSNVIVSFNHVDQGLETSDGKAPNWFEIAGADQAFVTAQATIVGDTVVVSSPDIAAPKYIRMAWNNIAEQNLRDKNGWPAFSFNAEVIERVGSDLFPGEKTDFHGFDRFAFKTQGVSVTVICPKKAAPGKPWLWRSLFWDGVDRFNQTDLKLVEQGYYVVLVLGDISGHPSGNKNIDAAYELLTSEYGFSKKCSMASMSRGTLQLFRWASTNPDKVESIYVDNGVCNVLSWPAGKRVPGNDSTGDGNPKSWVLFKEAFGYATDEEALKTRESPIDQLEPLAKAGVPILMVCGSKDSTVPYEENDAIMEQRYKALGGEITVIIEDKGHTHGMQDPTPVLEFIKKHTKSF
jgi:sialate O-acetylesterase